MSDLSSGGGRAKEFIDHLVSQGFENDKNLEKKSLIENLRAYFPVRVFKDS